MLRKIIAPAGYHYSGQRGTDTGKGNTTNGKYNLDPVSSLNNRYRPSTIFLMQQDCQMSFLTVRIKRPSLQFQTAYIIEHLLCDRHYTDYLISTILFNSHPQSVSYILLLNPILQKKRQSHHIPSKWKSLGLCLGPSDWALFSGYGFGSFLICFVELKGQSQRLSSEIGYRRK